MRYKALTKAVKAELFATVVEKLRTQEVVDIQEVLKREAATRNLDPDKLIQAWDAYAEENGFFKRPQTTISDEPAVPTHQTLADLGWEVGLWMQGEDFAGTIVRMQPYGAFVELDQVQHGDRRAQGLLHISQMAPLDEFVQAVQDYASEGQRVTVRVLSVEPHPEKGWLLRLSARESGHPLSRRKAAAVPREGGLATTSSGSGAMRDSAVRFAPGPMSIELLRMLEDLQAAYDGSPARLRQNREQFQLGLALCRTAVQAAGQ